MLPKHGFLRFYLISPESRDFLGFHCRAFIVYHIIYAFNIDFDIKF